MDELPLTVTRAEARAKLALRDSDSVLALMVGSRPSELRFHLAPMLEAARLTQAGMTDSRLKILIPIPETADLAAFQKSVAALSGTHELDLRISQGDAWMAIKAADAGLIKSGTSSLEAALLDLPHVVVYRAHPISELIFKHLIRYRKAISLTNLIGARSAESRVVPELILENFTPRKMADALLPLLREKSEAASAMREAFAGIRKILGERSPSERVAEEIFALATAGASR